MKRVMAVLALGLALISGSSAGAATSVQRVSFVAAGGYVGSVYAFGWAGSVTYPDGSGTNSTFGCAGTFDTNTNISEYGCGALSASLDPASRVGQVTGTVAGPNGPITVAIDFLGTAVSTRPDDFPYAFGEVNPYAPGATAFAYSNNQGRATGTVVTAFGSTTLPGVYAFGQSFNQFTAS